jgi:hypothetical protein
MKEFLSKVPDYLDQDEHKDVFTEADLMKLNPQMTKALLLHITNFEAFKNEMLHHKSCMHCGEGKELIALFGLMAMKAAMIKNKQV